MEIKFFTVPNLLTLSNLLCGAFASVAALVYGNLSWAFALIVLAAVFDFFDGFAARLLECPSPIGGELDSLADVVSFGFAPSAVLFSMYAAAPRWIAWNDTTVTVGGFLLFVVAAFAALRLAKFNIDQTQHTEFCGLPTPAAALFFASLGWLAFTGTLVVAREAILLLAVLISCLMIAPIRMFALKFQGFGWRGNELRYSFLALSAVLVALFRGTAVPAIILLYILISCIRWIRMRSKKDAGV